MAALPSKQAPANAVEMDAADARFTSPANMPTAITVAASDMLDSPWDGSNFGTYVDLYAPGKNITSASHDSDTATFHADGTSMACPHVAGVVALYLQDNPSATPAEVGAPCLTCCTAMLRRLLLYAPAHTVWPLGVEVGGPYLQDWGPHPDP